jgi:hypothetical protein
MQQERSEAVLGLHLACQGVLIAAVGTKISEARDMQIQMQTLQFAALH